MARCAFSKGNWNILRRRWNNLFPVWQLGFPGQRVAVALEQSRGALIFMLGKYAHLVLYPIHPNTVDHYRKSVFPSGR